VIAKPDCLPVTESCNTQAVSRNMMCLSPGTGSASSPVQLTTVKVFNTVCSGVPDEFFIAYLLTVNFSLSVSDSGLPSDAPVAVGW
jgi:hypothetical protein